MRFHSQNLNERKGRVGSMLRHGRCWLDLLGIKWRFEWAFGRSGSLGFQLALSDYDEDAIGGHVSLGWLCAFYWGMSTGWLKRWTDRITSRDREPRKLNQCAVCLRQEKGHGLGSDSSSGHAFIPRTYWSTNGRTMGVRVFEWILWIDLWNDPMEHRSSDPKWWSRAIHLQDVFLGRAVYKENPVETRRILVPMPEGGYRGTAVLSEDTWTRRWATKRISLVHITMDEGQGIPFPGKGENSWDCGEDACHGITVSAESIVEGMCKLTQSVLKDRIRYGGWNWQPEKVSKRV